MLYHAWIVETVTAVVVAAMASTLAARTIMIDSDSNNSEGSNDEFECEKDSAGDDGEGVPDELYSIPEYDYTTASYLKDRNAEP